MWEYASINISCIHCPHQFVSSNFFYPSNHSWCQTLNPQYSVVNMGPKSYRLINLCHIFPTTSDIADTYALESFSCRTVCIKWTNQSLSYLSLSLSSISRKCFPLRTVLNFKEHPTLLSRFIIFSSQCVFSYSYVFSLPIMQQVIL